MNKRMRDMIMGIEETPKEYFDREMKKQLEKEGHLRKIKRQSYVHQLESLSETELEIFMEAVNEVQKEQKS